MSADGTAYHPGPTIEEDPRGDALATGGTRYPEGVKLLSPPAETQLVRAGLGESKEEEKMEDALQASYAMVFTGSFEEDRIASVHDNNKMVASEDQTLKPNQSVFWKYKCEICQATIDPLY